MHYSVYHYILHYKSLLFMIQTREKLMLLTRNIVWCSRNNKHMTAYYEDVYDLLRISIIALRAFS